MNFTEIANTRQSCRNYDAARPVETEKLRSVLAAARLAPSACNAQPYHFTVCKGGSARQAAGAVMEMGMNKFAANAPVLIVISEAAYSKSAALGAKVKNNDYRSIDIGITAAYLTAEATAQGLGSCILGWFNEGKLQKLCGIQERIRLVITLGYPTEGDPRREKKRKNLEALVTEMN